MLHYILKCIHLEWRWLFGPFRYMFIQTVWLIVLIISIPDEELFSETAVGCTASYFVKIIWCSCWFCKPPPYFETEYCLFCGRRRVAVARYRMICLVLLQFSSYYPLNNSMGIYWGFLLIGWLMPVCMLKCWWIVQHQKDQYNSNFDRLLV